MRTLIKVLCGALVAAVLVPIGAAHPAGAADVVIQIDTAQRLAPIGDRVRGVVMQVASQTTPADRASDIGLKSGRYAAYWHAHTAGNMPVCWDPDDSTRFQHLDEDLSKGFSDGLVPANIHLQLAYVSPCDIAPEAEPVLTQPIGNQGFTPANPQWPSVSLLAVETHPELVEAMLYDQIDHAVSTWGIARFTVHNEPDGLYPAAIPVYLDYYDLVHSALKRVEAERATDLKIGGPVSAFASSPYIPALLDHVVANNLDLDAVVYHSYSENGFQPTSTKHADDIAHIRSLVADRQATAPWLQPEIHLNEWGLDPTSTNEQIRTAAGAAFIASSLTTFVHEDLDAADYFWYQDDKGERNGDDDRLLYGLLDDQDNRRPSWHAFRLFWELGTDRVAASPAYAQLSGRQEWGAIATLDGDGRLRVLVRNWDPQESGQPIQARLDIAGFSPVSWEMEEIGVSTGDSVVTSSGIGTPTVDLPPNHVALITLEPGEAPAPSDTGWLAPSSDTPDATAGDGDGWETDTVLAYSDGGGAALNVAGVGDRHAFDGFSATLPSRTQVTGADVQVDWWVSGANWSPQLDVELSWDGGATWLPPVTTPVGATSERSDTVLASAQTIAPPAGVRPEDVAVRVRARCTASLCGNIDWYLDRVSVRLQYARCKKRACPAF